MFKTHKYVLTAFFLHVFIFVPPGRAEANSWDYYEKIRENVSRDMENTVNPKVIDRNVDKEELKRWLERKKSSSEKPIEVVASEKADYLKDLVVEKPVKKKFLFFKWENPDETVIDTSMAFREISNIKNQALLSLIKMELQKDGLDAKDRALLEIIERN